MKRLLILSIVTVISLMSGSAMARHHGDDKPFRHDILHSRIAQKLELSDAQKAQIQTILEQTHESRLYQREEFADTRSQLTQLVQTTESFDEQQARALITEKQANQLENKLASLSARHQIWNVLTEEQQATLKEMQSKRGRRNRHSH